MARFASLILVLCFSVSMTSLLSSPAVGQSAKKPEKEAASKELKLDDLFPEKSMFGPSARSPQFSADGRYAAYLYRPYEKRRHGSDLWVHDFKTGKQVQLTGIEMMAEFQRSARLVKDDRIEKHKKTNQKESQASKKKSKQSDGKGEDESDADEDDTNDDDEDESLEESADADAANKKGDDQKKTEKKTQEELDAEREIYTKVTDKDADDEFAPRYSGISSFKWHPVENQLMLSTESDLYLIDDISKPKLARLTKTAGRESQADFLPDGSGYSYSSGDSVMRVQFGSHIIEQINPGLESGQQLSRHEISPDGKRLLIVGRTSGRSGSERRVDIIRYRDRFAKSDSVSRTVSDDTVKAQTVSVYLYDLDAADTEESKLIKVFETKIDEPRDVISTPKWSLDSEKVTFCFFNQDDSEVQIMLADFPDAKELKKATSVAEKAAKAKRKAAAKKKEDDEDDDAIARRVSALARAPITLKHDAKVIYQFKHYGGPNTPRMISPDFAGDNKHVVFISEQSGYRHVHMIDPLYESVRQLTSGQFEVYPIRFSDDHTKLFVTSTKDSAARQMVYTLELESGEMERLNKEDGTFSSVAVSNDGKRLVGNFVTYGQLTELVWQDGKKKPRAITDSHPKKAKELTKVKPEFFEFENRHGHKISGMMFKPKGWKKSEKHPLLIYVYGGPLGSRHSVNDGSYSSDGYFFQMYMAQKHGYMTIVVDPRGQSGYGGLFEKANFEQVGKPQVEDLVDGVKHMVSEYNVDDKRVAIYGWSFGGFQTQMCLYTQPDVFQVGMAGAGPTQWENYNSWYTTGTVGPSRKGEPDQEKYSLIPLAKKLKGKMLLVHGMEDTNVLFQDTVAVYRALLKAGKETNVELFLDPTGGHGLGGDVKRIGRMRKYEEFLLRTIGKME